MSSPRLRSQVLSRWVFIAVLASIALAGAARADDGEPVHSAYDMALAEDAMPEGWKLSKSADGAKDESTVKDAIAAVAAEKKLAPEGYVAVMRSASTADGKKAVFALIDLVKASPEFQAGLEEAAKTKGWTVRTIASPLRVLVVAAPDDLREKAVALQLGFAARMLGIKAESAGEWRRAREFALVVVALDEKDAKGNLILGTIEASAALQMTPGTPDVARLDKGIALVEKAISKDATRPLSAGDAATARGNLGGFILNKGGASTRARDVLKEAVKNPGAAGESEIMGWRYNLACAHGRLKEVDEAFANLTPVLVFMEKTPVEGMAHWRKDPDFDNLHADARWAEFLKKYGAEAPKEGE